MAYQTGTATNANDLLDKFRVFAIAQGWTVNRWADVGSNKELCIHKGSAYFNFKMNNQRAYCNGQSVWLRGITVNGADGYDAAGSVHRQPNYPKRVASIRDEAVVLFPLTTMGPFIAHHFFAPDNKTLYAEVELTAGCFLRFGCGSLDVFGSTAHGQFCYASTGQVGGNWLSQDMDRGNNAIELVPFRAADYNSNRYSFGSMVRVQLVGFDNWASSGRSTFSAGLPMACQGGGVHDKVLRDYGANPLNGVGLLLPNIVSLNIGNQYLAPIGTVPGMRYMDMSQYEAGDEFTLGSDTWKVFPWYNKGGLSLNRGIAYLKN